MRLQQNRWIWIVMMMGLVSFVSPAMAQEPAPTDAKPAAADEETTMTLNLNNVSLDQLVKFISDTTGKAVLKQKNIQQQVTITSPEPVTQKEALNLIYKALLMEKIYVIELEDSLQIVSADSVRNMQLRSLGDEEDLQTIPDSLEVLQKIYHLKHIKADDLKKHLEKIVPEQAMTFESNTNTLILTDQVSRLKHYDRVIKALDSVDASDSIIEIFRLEHADAIELATLVGNVLTQSQAGAPGSQPGGRMQMPPNYGRRSSSRGQRGDSTAIMAGEVVIVPDPRMNWLIVSASAEDMKKVTKLVEEFDIEEKLDVKSRFIEIKHIEATAASNMASRLFMDDRGKSARDEIRIVATDDGNQVIVLSSAANYELIKELVEKLDTEEAEKRETRTYVIEHLESSDLAEQLTDLFEEQQSSNNYWSYYSRQNNQNDDDPSFVPSPRTNTLMVLARPKDFEFIEEMIEELDVPMSAEAFQPRIYHIKHTDANELVSVLEELFKEDSTGRNQQNYYWRSSNNDKKKDSLQAQFGKLRFVVDNVTNTVVVLASNPQNYEIIDNMIQKLDQIDPDTSEVLIYDLKFAEATEIADHINNLFSEGAVQRASGSQQQNQNRQNQNGEEDSSKNIAKTVRDIVFPWQSGGANQRGQEESRPINTMIGNVRAVPDTRSNKLLVAAPSIYFDTLRALILDLDLREPQVNISTKIVEILRGEDKRIGTRWTPDPSQIDPAELDNAFLGLGQLGFLDAFGGNKGNPFDSTVNSGLNNIGHNYSTTTQSGNTILSSNLNMALLIQLLVRNSNSQIIGEPSIVVNNNEIGNLFVGSKYPFRTNVQTTSDGGQNFGIERDDVGITLDIQPIINTEGQIVLTVFLENSQVREGELIDGNLITDQVKLHTETAVDDGETMVLGGIILETKSKSSRKVPILGSIPGLKYLFGKTDNTLQVRELMVFITPTVLRQPSDIAPIVKEMEERIAESEAKFN